MPEPDRSGTTAFVSHYDCSRHDTGWAHPDHQGRLPAIMRAVYADMLTLFDSLVEVEGRHASDEELLLVHTPGYLRQVQGWVDEAARAGRPIQRGAELMISGATWDASVAAVGCVLTGIDAVLEGKVGNAFCAVRPPGRDAAAENAGRFGALNALAVGARYLHERWDVDRVGVVAWGGTGGIGVPAAPLEAASGTSLFEVRLPTDSFTVTGSPPERDRGLAEGLESETASSGSKFAGDYLVEATGAAVQRMETAGVDVVLLSASFDGLPNDPLAAGSLRPSDFYDATLLIREYADAACGGRMVSVLEGGFEPRGTGAAVVQHLRALARLERAPGD